jgi:hypothetical protein
LTLWGRYQYCTTPQGFLAAGDGYCHRYDFITRDVQNFKRCVDNSCLWEDAIEEQFLATCGYLTLRTNNGNVYTWKKFVFCQKELEFVGFWLGEDRVRQTTGMLESIANFPRPADISRVQSYF